MKRNKNIKIQGSLSAVKRESRNAKKNSILFLRTCVTRMINLMPCRKGVTDSSKVEYASI